MTLHSLESTFFHVHIPDHRVPPETCDSSIFLSSFFNTRQLDLLDVWDHLSLLIILALALIKFYRRRSHTSWSMPGLICRTWLAYLKSLADWTLFLKFCHRGLAANSWFFSSRRLVPWFYNIWPFLSLVGSVHWLAHRQECTGLTSPSRSLLAYPFSARLFFIFLKESFFFL